MHREKYTFGVNMQKRLSTFDIINSDIYLGFVYKCHLNAYFYTFSIIYFGLLLYFYPLYCIFVCAKLKSEIYFGLNVVKNGKFN